LYFEFTINSFPAQLFLFRSLVGLPVQKFAQLEEGVERRARRHAVRLERGDVLLDYGRPGREKALLIGILG
jgi:hypothetical protein